MRYKEWHPDSTMYTTDFMMLHNVLKRDSFAAAISTDIFVRQSDDGTVSAYTAMDRFNSWYIKAAHSSYLLNHEAYHANITSIGTKWLNEKILKQSLSFDEAVEAGSSIMRKIYKLQKEYDYETNHSTKQALQHYWEYKVDSILNQGIKLNTIDQFSGATAYFPAQPEIFIKKDTFMLFKIFQLEKYEMKFRMITKYDHYVDTTNYENEFVEFLNSMNFKDISSSFAKYNDMLMVETRSTDTVNNRVFHDRLLYDNKHEYQLTVFHPITAHSDSVYEKLAARFFDSFTLKSQEEMWKKEFLSSQRKPTIEVTHTEGSEANITTFTALPYSDCSISYHDPIVIDNELVIPFRSEKHKSDDIDEVLVIVNREKIYSQEVDSVNQFIHLNLSELKEPVNSIQFGYVTKSDSIKETYHLYGSVIENYKTPEEHK